MDKKKPANVPRRLESRLRVRQLRPDLEPLARELFELACAGSRELWPDLTPERLKIDAAFRDRFHVLVHDGMYEAQKRIVARILNGAPLDVSETILFRGVADSIAWAMIGGQLCYARRMYRGHKQPDLTQSNLESVVLAVQALRDRDAGCMPLITDLTSFIQVGDVLCVSRDRQISMIEVKEGEHNKRVLGMVGLYQESGCERFRDLIRRSESPKTVKQFERVIRQEARMGFVGEVMGKGYATDPDSGVAVFIPEPTIMMDSWDESLDSVIRTARDNKWAYDVKGAVFMGAYSGDPWLTAGHLAFLGALGLVGDVEKEFHIIRLADCMNHPLAPPRVFSTSRARHNV